MQGTGATSTFGFRLLRRRLRLDRSGASAVEFALIVPLLLTMTCAALQYGTLMFAYNGMMNAARDATRQMSVGAANSSSATQAARASLPPWVAAGSWQISANDAAAGAQVSTSISVNSSAVSILQLVPMPSRMTVNVAMLKES